MVVNRLKSNLKIKRRKKQNQIITNIKKQRTKKKNQLLQNVQLVFGFDNGSTGTLCSWNLINDDIDFIQTPSKHVLNYQQKITYIDRIDHQILKNWIKNCINNAKKIYKETLKIIIIIQRPMVNPQRFDASLNAVRAYQSTIIILEELNIEYIVIDSKNWQHYFFGSNTININLKTESMKLGKQLINDIQNKTNKKLSHLIEIINKHGDADALLITKYSIDKLIRNN